MKIKGNEVLRLSNKGNVAVAYSQFDLGEKYKVYRKVRYDENSMWEYSIGFGTQGEATRYAERILDVEVERWYITNQTGKWLKYSDEELKNM